MGTFERISAFSLVSALAGSACTIISFQTFTGHIAEWRYDLLSIGFFLMALFPYLFAWGFTIFDKAPRRMRKCFAVSLLVMQIPPMLTGYNMIRELIGQNDTNSPQQIILFALALTLTTTVHVRYATEFAER